MYKRVEQIEEEDLDWGHEAGLFDETRAQEEDLVFAPAFKIKKIFWQGSAEFNIEKKLMKFFDKNMAVASFIGILFLPYFVGFLLAYSLFYTYGGMTIIGFLSMDKEYILFQLWSIGAYLFVTLWVLWAFSQIVTNSKEIFHLSHS